MAAVLWASLTVELGENAMCVLGTCPDSAIVDVNPDGKVSEGAPGYLLRPARLGGKASAPGAAAGVVKGKFWHSICSEVSAWGPCLAC